MLRFIGKRLLAIIPVVVVVTFLVFVLIELAPGDAANSIAGDGASQEQVRGGAQRAAARRALLPALRGVAR